MRIYKAVMQLFQDFFKFFYHVSMPCNGVEMLIVLLHNDLITRSLKKVQRNYPPLNSNTPQPA
jgi:hypothetical protein